MEDWHNQNIIHNDHGYYMNINKFHEISLVASKNLDLKGSFPAILKDCLDEQSFSTLVQYINDPLFKITYVNILLLLKSSIVYRCKTLIEQIQNILSAPKYSDQAIQAIELSFQYQTILDLLENYIAHNFNNFISKPQFSNLPCHIIYRIITWYNQTFEVTQEILEFYFRILQIRGTQATPLFLTINYAKLSPQMITRILSMKQLDFESIGPLIMQYVEKTEQDHQAMQDLLNQKKSQVSNLKSEYDRVNAILEQTEQRQRLLTLKQADLESKKDALISELKSHSEKSSQLENQILQIRDDTQQIVKQKDEINNQKNSVQRDTEEMINDIAILKQQIADREMQQKAAAAARELIRKDEEMRHRLEEMKKQEELKKKEELKKLEEQKVTENLANSTDNSQNNAGDVEQKQNYIEPSLTIIEFDPNAFKKAFIQKKDIKVEMISPPATKYTLSAEGFSRACELEFMWTCAQNYDEKYRSSYGALLLMNDPQSLDLAASLLFQAAEKEEPYALYNIGALIALGVLEGEREDAADYICRAAMKGEPDAQMIVKKLVKWDVPAR